LVRVNDHCATLVALGETKKNPESIPAVGVVMFWQGAAKVDCVAVWFLDKNEKLMVSPTAAKTWLGW